MLIKDCYACDIVYRRVLESVQDTICEPNVLIMLLTTLDVDTLHMAIRLATSRKCFQVTVNGQSVPVF